MVVGACHRDVAGAQVKYVALVTGRRNLKLFLEIPKHAPAPYRNFGRIGKQVM